MMPAIRFTGKWATERRPFAPDFLPRTQVNVGDATKILLSIGPARRQILRSDTQWLSGYRLTQENPVTESFLIRYNTGLARVSAAGWPKIFFKIEFFQYILILQIPNS
jgi:hypothetical protein